MYLINSAVALVGAPYVDETAGNATAMRGNMVMPGETVTQFWAV